MPPPRAARAEREVKCHHSPQILVLGRRDLRDPRHGREQDAAGREDPVEGRERSPHVVDELERLGDDRAVEARRRGCAAHPSGRRRSSPAGSPPSPSGCRPTRRRFRTGSCSRAPRSRAHGRGCRCVAADEALDVDAVDRRPALEAPVGVDRRRRAGGPRGSAAAAAASRRTRAGRGRSRRRTAAGTNVRQPAKAAIIVPSCRATSREARRRRLPALGRRRALARRCDGAWAREAARVELLTVFALDPDRSPGGRLGRSRRLPHRGRRRPRAAEEDARACAILGVTPSWLPFGSVDYERHGDETSGARRDPAARRGRRRACSCPASRSPTPTTSGSCGAAAPRWAAASGSTPSSRTRAEGRQRVTVAEWSRTRSAAARVRRVRGDVRDRLAKWRAIRQYRTQLPLLGMRRSLRRGPHSLACSASVSPGHVDRRRLPPR